MPQSLDDARKSLVKQFRDKRFDDPEREARIVLSLSGFAPVDWLARGDQPLDGDQQTNIERITRARLAGVPPARLAGEASFYGRTFKVGPMTLDPRADTETLIDAVKDDAEAILARKGALRLADVGTGTGAIAVTLALAHPRAQVWATDLARGAVRIARQNARALGASGVRVVHADLLDRRHVPGNFDMIVSNPPYIARPVLCGLDAAVRRFDPHLALDGGPDGLRIYRRLIAEAHERLRANGVLALEIGYNQAAPVSALLETGGFSIREIVPDLGGRDRVIMARRGARQAIRRDKRFAV